jgi:CHAT domain-containing protein
MRSGTSSIDPLLTSGILLAPDDRGDEDGLLTAQELLGHDLRQVDWVVLSACRSALGQILIGEGVFGLRRAFEIAGARSVLMALWTINDEVAADLMERIYHHRLAGRSTIDAVRLAQLERLREQRERWNRIHPALWGGIVVEGDWR